MDNEYIEKEILILIEELELERDHYKAESDRYRKALEDILKYVDDEIEDGSLYHLFEDGDVYKLAEIAGMALQGDEE